jgi:hypothetical protein
MQASTDGSNPPGCEANSSSWPERLPIIGLALLGTVIAAYLTVFQVGLIADVWEPLFGDGSRRILASGVSHPPDPGRGARHLRVPRRCRYRRHRRHAAVADDALGGRALRRRRWAARCREHLLVVLQAVMFDAWCMLCLASAAVSLAMIGPAMDEVLASLQHLRRVHDGGGSVVRAFLGASGA